MKLDRRIGWFCFLGISLLLGRSVAAERAPSKPLSEAQMEKLRALIKPAEDEDTWAKIPWLTSLWEARKKAAAEGKPIVLWEMDGHPLGCT